MNAMDVRLIGASALTAAVVSVVTVAVLGLARRECPPAAPVVVNLPAVTAPPALADDSEDAVDDSEDAVDDGEEADDVEVDVDDSVTYDFGGNGCVAEVLKDKGMANINMGQHAAALAQFEASLRCEDDPYVRQLAFMEACASNNSPKAKYYYKRLTPAQQTKFAQICIRQKPPVDYQ